MTRSSHLFRDSPRRSPQGLRRLRFPFFYQLVKEQQRRMNSRRLLCRLTRQQDPFRCDRWGPLVVRLSKASRGLRSNEVRRNEVGSSPKRTGCQSPSPKNLRHPLGFIELSDSAGKKHSWPVGNRAVCGVLPGGGCCFFPMWGTGSGWLG